MADDIPGQVKKCEENYVEQGSVVAEIVEEDLNRNISDPEILEAIMASLKEAEDALEEPDNQDEMEDQVEETVEITKMDLQVEEGTEVLDSFVFSDITESSSGTKGVEVKEDDVSIVDTKKQQVIKPATRKRKKSSPTLRAPIPLKKARGRPRKVIEENRETSEQSFSEEEVDVGLTNGDTEYKPGGNKSKALLRNKKSSMKKALKECVVFECDECSFQSDILGELKIHSHNTHEGCEAPSYLDMAEAAIAKLEDSSGVMEMSILKEVLFENFDSISEDKSSASQLLSQALRAGVKLGRLQMSRKGRGQNRFRVVIKERMKLVLEKWRVNHVSVEWMKSGVKSTLRKNTRNMKRKMKTSGESPKVKFVVTKADQDDDDDIAILNESLTLKTKLRMMKKFSAPQVKVQLVEFPQNIIPQSPPRSGCYEDDCNSMLTCPVCYCSFWYQDQTMEHVRIEHGDEWVEKIAMLNAEEKVDISVVDPKVCSKSQQDQNEKVNECEQGERKFDRDDKEEVKEHDQGKPKVACDNNGNMLEYSSGEEKFDATLGLGSRETEIEKD